MIALHFRLPLIFAFLICSCQANEKEENEDYLPIIEFDLNAKTSYLEEELFNNLRYVFLKDEGKYFINRINKLIDKDSRIYIADCMQGSIFVFDHEGQPLKVFNSVGKGPGEYSRMSDVEFADQHYIVWDWDKSELLYYTYNGEFILSRKFDSGNTGSKFTLCDGKFYFDRKNGKDTLEGHNIAVFDSATLTLQGTHFEIPSVIQNLHFINKNTTTFENAFYYIPLISDRIYSISAEGIANTAFKFITPDGKFHAVSEYDATENHPAKFTESIKNQNVIGMYDYLTITKDFILFGFYFPESCTVIYSKKSKTSKVVRNYPRPKKGSSKITGGLNKVSCI